MVFIKKKKKAQTQQHIITVFEHYKHYHSFVRYVAEFLLRKEK